MRMHPNIHSYRNGMYILQRSQKDIEGQEEAFVEEVTCTYHIDFTFWSLKQGQSSHMKQFLCGVHHAVRSIKK